MSALLFGFALFLMGCGADYERPTAGTTIVAFGDSLTAGYGLEDADAYPAQLAVALGEDVLNYGVSGDTTAQALARTTDVLAADPRIVIILLGGNDVFQRVSPDMTFDNLEAIVSRFQEVGAGVILVGVRGGLHNVQYKREFEELAQRRNIPYVEDSLAGIFGNKDLMYDAVHPNAAGYAILVERLLPVVQKMLQSAL